MTTAREITRQPFPIMSSGMLRYQSMRRGNEFEAIKLHSRGQVARSFRAGAVAYGARAAP